MVLTQCVVISSKDQGEGSTGDVTGKGSEGVDRDTCRPGRVVTRRGQSSHRTSFKQSWRPFIVVLCPGTFAHFKHEMQGLSRASFYYLFVFQGSTVAREASDKEKVSARHTPHRDPMGVLKQHLLFHPSF